MAKLYELTNGKISRKNASGAYETGVAPFQFVPSPSEFKTEKLRLKEIGPVSDDSDYVLAALHNTNLETYPDAFGASRHRKAFGATTVAAATAVAVQVEDIRKIVDVQAALTLIAAETSAEKLNLFLDQETQNKPRVRKIIVKTLTERLDTLTKPAADPASASIDETLTAE